MPLQIVTRVEDGNILTGGSGAGCAYAALAIAPTDLDESIKYDRYPYEYVYTIPGMRDTDWVDISIVSGNYSGNYAVESDTDTIIVYFASLPDEDLTVNVYYIVANQGGVTKAEQALLLAREALSKAEVMPKKAVLWENPDPSAAFAEQQITLSSDDYDFLLIVCAMRTSNLPYKYTATIRKSDSTRVLGSVSNLMYGRDFQYVSETLYNVSNCNNFTNNNKDSNVLVPIAIYGFKF